MLNFAVNPVGVVAATIAVMIVGAIWYMPLFGKKWMKLAGISEKQAKESMSSGMLGMLVGSLISVWALAVVLATVGATDVMSAAYAAVFVWFGFFLYLHAGSFLWEGKSYKLFLLNAGQTLVALVVAAAILVMLP